jgi:hypothetical protein
VAEKLELHAAANTLAPALAELSGLGFEVSRISNGEGERFYRAENSEMVVSASDTLQLLGLAVLAARRGKAASQPTDAEIAAVLRLDDAV